MMLEICCSSLNSWGKLFKTVNSNWSFSFCSYDEEQIVVFFLWIVEVNLLIWALSSKVVLDRIGFHLYDTSSPEVSQGFL